MPKSSAQFLFLGTMLAAAGYGATFLLSAYFRANGGSDLDTGTTLGAAMIGTFVGVPLVGWFSGLIRHFQTGYIYHYAFVMILGVLGFLIYFMPFPSFAK